MAKNASLHAAKAAQNDEFYTRLEDINEEMNHYEDKFRGKVVFCNCDDPTYSNFWRYFHIEFERLGLKKLIATHYEPGEVQTYKIEYSGGNDEDYNNGVVTPLQQNGDFRSDECIELLKEADIVVTNPPFSLFREYIALLIKYNTQFLVIGNLNAITYKEIFPLIRDNKLWLGCRNLNRDMYFDVPDERKEWLKKNKKEGSAYKVINGVIMGRLATACWFTNIDHMKRHRLIETPYLYAKKDELYPDLYPKYDNYDAINVDKLAEIPMDYVPCWYKCPHATSCKYAQTEGKADEALCEHACNGAMGVPVSFLDRYCPDQFCLIGHEHDICGNGGVGIPGGAFEIAFDKRERERERERERRQCYKRILIRRKV